jgi:glycosyltransferase involved in cell wall biosynthesis
MRFSIVTPSFRSAKWLPLCIASVADQMVEHEHIVQDSFSDDGTENLLRRDSRVIAIIEKDGGMYDAINRGFRRAKGELLAYLNADEQYLPGTLQKVNAFFAQHPEVDVAFGDVVVVDASGNYLCDRRSLVPQRLHTQVSGNLSFLTAAMFVRRRILEQHQLYFNSSMRTAGDAEWTLRLISSGARTALLKQFVSVFTETEANLGRSASAEHEGKQFKARAPRWAQIAAPAIVAHYRFRRLLTGAYFCRPYDYSIYTAKNPTQRHLFHVSKPTYRWRR